MIWTNPWAWLGMAALAVPILIHLLTRESSTPVPFPTLRFLKASTVVEARRRRMTDVPLLIVRCLILAFVVAALAQPFMASPSSNAVRRLVIVDITDSVDGAQAASAARSAAEGTADVRVIERRDLRAAIAEAATWADQLTGTREVAIVSDFQRGALDAGSVAALPAGTGLKLHQVPSRGLDLGATPGIELQLDHAATTAAWREEQPIAPLEIDTAQSPAVARAILAAASATADARRGALRPALFVLPDSPRIDALRRAATAALDPWAYGLVANVHGTSSIQDVRADSTRVIVFLGTSDPAQAADAIRQALPALGTGPVLAELEPAVASSNELRSLERETTAAAVKTPSTWIGRWFWLAALALLALETVMRRERRVAEAEVARAA